MSRYIKQKKILVSQGKLDKNLPGLIELKTFSSNFVRFFNKKIYHQCLKKETQDVYEKIIFGWDASKSGSLLE